MAEVMAQPTTSPTRKRNHDGDFVSHVGMSNDALTPNSAPSTNSTSRQASPAPSTTISELTELTSSVASPGPTSVSGLQVQGTSDRSTPAKKRKLTFAEREVDKAVKKREKEERERAKAEEKQRREEEKRQKDEERRQKEEEKEATKRAKELEKAERKKLDDAKKAEREEKKKVKDAEKQEKEAEKAKREAEKAEKEAEKQKKEKAQLRIGSFFGRPAAASTPPLTPDNVSVGVLSRRSSIASINMEEPLTETRTTIPANPEFEKYIIPYFVHENTDVAPINRFRAARSSDSFGGQSSEYELEVALSEIQPLRNRFRKSSRKTRNIATVRQILESSQQGSEGPTNISLLNSQLEHIPLKVLSFREDVRPPYMGTYSAAISPRSQRKMSRRPTHKGRPDTNYDYDSEAEWEPPAEDDDDINLEDELSDSEDEEDEMHDFLDDEDDTARRKLFVGEMEPVSSGLCWQDEPLTSKGSSMEEYRMDVLHDSTTFPINPFSSAHWVDETKTQHTHMKMESAHKDPTKVKPEAEGIAMPPPRLPLAPVNAPNKILNFTSGSNVQTANIPGNLSPAAKQPGRPVYTNKEVKMIADEFLPAFKIAVNGSDLTKTGLIEILKKQFPKCSKDAIKDTIGVIAVRVGKKEADKKWELV